MVRHISQFLLVWVSLIAVVCSEERPNFVYFLVDDLGYMDIRANNPDTFYGTPHLDRLAATGMRFNRCVCHQSRVQTCFSIVAGNYPTRVGETNWFSGRRNGKYDKQPLQDAMPLGEVTLAEALNVERYQTGFLGKWHSGSKPSHWPEAQGFDVNIGGHSKGSPPGGYFAPYTNPRMKSGPEGAYLNDRLASEAASLID